MDIRPATDADLPEVQSIYAHHVLHGAGTFEEVPPSVAVPWDRFLKVERQAEHTLRVAREHDLDLDLRLSVVERRLDKLGAPQYRTVRKGKI